MLFAAPPTLPMTGLCDAVCDCNKIRQKMEDTQSSWSVFTVLTTKMLRKIDALNIKKAKMRLGDGVRVCMSYRYL